MSMIIFLMADIAIPKGTMFEVISYTDLEDRIE